MPMSLKTYDALKRGLADGVLLPMETLKGWKFGEVCKHTYVNHGNAYGNGFFVAMNKQTWNSLPKDIQQIIDKLNEEWFEKQAKLWNHLDEEGLRVREEGGSEVRLRKPRGGGANGGKNETRVRWLCEEHEGEGPALAKKCLPGAVTT